MAPRKLLSFAEGEVIARFEEHADLTQQNRNLRNLLKAEQAVVAQVRRKLDIYERIDTAAIRAPKWPVPARSTKHHGVPCLEVADIHWAAVVKPEEINGLNAYNMEIAEGRLRRTFEGAVKLSRDYFAGLKYDGCQVFLPGDCFSGEIHAELRETNAVTIADAIVSLLEPMKAGIQMLRDEFGSVKIAGVVGNHSRRTRKPIAKHRVADNYDYLFYRMLQREFANDAKVDVFVSPSPDALVQVYDTRYVLSHGDQAHGGSGIAAELSPLLLMVHRKQRRDATNGKPFDVLVLGHWHRTLMLPQNGLIVGGSIMGYDEYAFNSNFKPEPPLSAFWVDTPERGAATFMAPVHCLDRAAEGW